MIHGEQFDSVVRSSRAIALLGSHAYDLLLGVNTRLNLVRLHPSWIPAFAGMTISGVCASLGWSFDTAANAGIQGGLVSTVVAPLRHPWIPAFAGMTIRALAGYFMRAGLLQRAHHTVDLRSPGVGKECDLHLDGRLPLTGIHASFNRAWHAIVKDR